MHWKLVFNCSLQSYVSKHFKHHFCQISPKLAQISPNLQNKNMISKKISTDFARILSDVAWIFTKSKLLGVRLHPRLLHQWYVIHKFSPSYISSFVIRYVSRSHTFTIIHRTDNTIAHNIGLQQNLTPHCFFILNGQEIPQSISSFIVSPCKSNQPMHLQMAAVYKMYLNYGWRNFWWKEHLI